MPPPTGCCAARSRPAPGCSLPTPTAPLRSTRRACCAGAAASVGRLVAGERMLTPRAEPLAGDFIEGEARDKIRQRLAAFVRAEIERRLAPLFAASALPLGGLGRGLAFQLAEALGALPAAAVAAEVAALAPADRAALGRLGVRFGVSSRLCRDPAATRGAALSRACCGRCGTGGTCRCCRPARPARQGHRRSIPPCRRRFTQRSAFLSPAIWRLRADRLERLAAAARRRSRATVRSPPTQRLAAIAGIEPGGLRPLLTALGYRAVIDAGAETFVARPRRRRDPARAKPSASAARGPSIRQVAGIEARLSAGALGPAGAEPAARPVAVVRPARQEPLARGAAVHRRSGNASTASPVRKANHLVRIGDIVAVPQGRVPATGAGSGARRASRPGSEARQLYEDIAAPIRLADLAPAWEPLLADSDLDPHY